MVLTRAQLANNVRENLGDLGITWYSIDAINESLQDGYNLLSALIAPIQKTCFYPLNSRPYYHLTDYIFDLFGIQGIYNPQTNLWLDYQSIPELNKQRWDWERWNGQACFWCPMSFRTTLIVPWNTSASGVLYIAYTAKADLLSDSSVPNIPTATQALLENYSTCDLLEQAREFKKAQKYLNDFKDGLSLTTEIVKDIARIHRLRVMEPWSVMGRYSGSGPLMTIISDEVPAGAVDGVNTIYNLAGVPNPTSSLSLYKNGQLLHQSDSYTLVGNIITMTSQAICSGTDSLRAWYEVN